jgi:hypothetical protein
MNGRRNSFCPLSLTFTLEIALKSNISSLVIMNCVRGDLMGYETERGSKDWKCKKELFIYSIF